MRTFIVFLCFLPFAATAQKIKPGIYGNAYGVFVKSNNFSKVAPGPGLIAGFTFHNFGLGAGSEAFPIFQGKIAIPLFGDFRYTFHKSLNAVATPFISLNAGKLLWKRNEETGAPIDNSTIYYTGKHYFSAEAGLVFLKSGKHGLFVSLGYKNYQADYYSIHRTTISQTGATIPLVETRSRNSSINFNAVAFKVGYSF